METREKFPFNINIYSLKCVNGNFDGRIFMLINDALQDAIFVLFQIEREKLRSEEIASKSALERENMDRNLNHLDEENQELQKQLQHLQASLSDAEQQHSQR